MIRPLALLAAVAALAPWLPEGAAGQRAPAPRARTLQAFRSVDEIEEFYHRLEREEREWNARQPPPSPMIAETPMDMYLRLVAPPDPAGTPRQLERPVSPDDPGEAVRQTGGDERPVAAVQGDYLVALHRGRLFTVRIGGGALQPVAAVDAFGPQVSHLAGWHDEVLASGGRVVVIGSNDRLFGTEMGVFDLAADGRLAHRATYRLPSASIYGSHLYAARVADGRLVLYEPLRMQGTDPPAPTPVLFRADSARVHAAVPPTRLYRPAEPVSWDDPLQLHTVLTCDLAAADLRCEATAVLAPPAEVYYVSPTSVYLWTRSRRGQGSVLYRLPLDGSAPTALHVSGRPADPSSFLESGDGHLDVLVRSDESSARMWGPANAGAALALLRVPLSALGDGSGAAAPGQYRVLPFTSPGLQIQNRFVGDWLVYAVSGGRDAYAVRWAAGGDPSWVTLGHRVDRIEAMGPDAALIGAEGMALQVSTLRLGPGATVAPLPWMLAGETRSNGFFYHPGSDGAGVLGLPVHSTERPAFTGMNPGSAPIPPGPPLYLGPTRILFLRSHAHLLQEIGELGASAPSGDDACLEGCRHWFGNAQPLFVGGRTFALLGYELVEGREEGGRLREVRRVSFAPAPPTDAITGDWTFTEYVGTYRSRYFCSNRGTMRLDRSGGALTMRYRQTGECTIDGAKTSSDGEGSGSGTVGPASLSVQVGPCRSQGTMTSAHHIEGTLACRIAMPDGTALDVIGRWTAQRPQP
jgi:hypothetical protein